MRRLCLILCFVVLALPAIAQAEARALLIGVSDYLDDNLGLEDLAGPANDIELMSEVLERRGVADIATLGGPGDPVPTRAAILAALDALTGRAMPGDFVYIHLSGHGTQAPDASGDEADGLDELFLPADATRSRDGTAESTRALSDDELGARVQVLRAKGVDVWVVIDSCHSGSGLRAGETDRVPRFVAPETLGLSPVTTRSAELLLDVADDDLPGGLVAFYAARASELAFEASFARPGEEPVTYGLFTAALAARLGGGAPMTYRQLFTSVMADFRAGQTPAWEGNRIDRPVFGAGQAVPEPRFALRGDELRAGRLHGIEEGAVLALYADAFDPPRDMLGLAQAETPEATLAYLRPVSADCDPDTVCPANGALPRTARFAALHARPAAQAVRIAPPPGLASGHPVAQALASATRAPDAPVAIGADGADVRTYWDGDRLWFGVEPERVGRGVGLSWSPEDGPLAPLLARIAEAERLADTLGAVAGDGFLLTPAPVTLAPILRATDASDLDPPGAGGDIFEECGRALRAAQGTAPVRLENRALLKQCDQVQMRAEANTSGEWDLNLVSIDAQFCIRADYQRVDGTSAAAIVGGTKTICSDCPTGYAAGHERNFLITTEAPRNAAPLNLSGLVETCTARDATRSAASAEAAALFDALGARPLTRGSFGGFGLSEIWVERFDWIVQPKAEVFDANQ